ncbi:PP2C family protein-serine/threonine phosphatase [Candidatus Sumerlaeota bacterium]
MAEPQEPKFSTTNLLAGLLFLPALIALPALAYHAAQPWAYLLLIIALGCGLGGSALLLAHEKHERSRRHLAEKELKRMERLLDKRTQKLNSINEMLMNMLNKADLELEDVGSFQQRLLPEGVPPFKGFKFATLYQPSGRASGDYYDFIEINPTTIGIMVADVSGHGSRASVVMAITRVLMQSYATAYTSPAQLLARINRIMTRLIPTEDFVTAFYGILHRDTNRFRYATAGHPYGILLSAAGDKVKHLDDANGIPLKIMEEYDYVEAEIELQLGDRLIIYTDGVIEAANPQGTMFESDRLVELCLNNGDKPLKRQIQDISQKVIEFAEFDNLADDFTILGIERTDREHDQDADDATEAPSADAEIDDLADVDLSQFDDI